MPAARLSSQRTAPYVVDVIWSDDVLCAANQNGNSIAKRLHGATLRSPQRREIQANVVALVAKDADVLPTLRKHWGVKRPDHGPLRVWIADLEFNGDKDAGLRQICAFRPDEIDSDGLLVFSEHAAALGERLKKEGVLERLRKNLHVELSSLKPVINDVMEAIAAIVDKRLVQD